MKHETCRADHHIDKKKLIKKGWTVREIRKVLHKFKRAESKKTKGQKHLDFIIYWFILLIAVTANFLVSVTLVPIMLVLTGSYLVFMLILLGLVFGYLFTELIKEVEHFQHKKVVVAEIFIPAIGLMNIYLITQMTNYLAVRMELLGGIHNPIAISFLYVFSFSIPRIYHVLMRWHIERELKEVRT